GGVAYVWDPEGTFKSSCNMAMVELSDIAPHEEQLRENLQAGWHSPQRGQERQTDESIVRTLVENHFRLTGSFRARDLLGDWDKARKQFVKVMPTDYKRALAEIWQSEQTARKAA